MIQTIYSTQSNQQNLKGVVEIINMYDNRYFSIAIDGQIIRTTYKSSYESTVLKRSFIKDCVTTSGVDENNLLFVYIDWESFGHDNMTDYDSNDFETYSEFTDFLNNNPGVTFSWKDMYFSFVRVLANGIEELEEKIS